MDGQKELEDLIKSGNPFNDAVLSDWRKQLDDFNASAAVCPLPNFKMDADEKWIAAYQNKFGKKEKGLHFELLPDPFRGDPRAPVWILLLNPGYSEVDRYDHLGLCPFCGERLVRADGKATSHENGCAARFFGSRLPDASAALRYRQNMLIEELKLDLSTPRKFLWFEPVFHTVTEENVTVAGKGGSLWWKNFLFGKAASNSYLLPNCNITEPTPTIGNRIFALEVFPYHSMKFDPSFLDNELYRESKYFEFWCSLVRWAVDTGRKIIVRYAAVERALKNAIGADFANKKDDILCMASIKPSLTIQNLCGKDCVANSKVAVNELCNVLKERGMRWCAKEAQ